MVEKGETGLHQWHLFLSVAHVAGCGIASCIDTICIILHIIDTIPLSIYNILYNILFCVDSVHCRQEFVVLFWPLCTAKPRNYDCTTPQCLASGLRRRLLELEGHPPSHL